MGGRPANDACAFSSMAGLESFRYDRKRKPADGGVSGQLDRATAGRGLDADGGISVGGWRGLLDRYELGNDGNSHAAGDRRDRRNDGDGRS